MEDIERGFLITGLPLGERFDVRGARAQKPILLAWHDLRPPRNNGCMAVSGAKRRCLVSSAAAVRPAAPRRVNNVCKPRGACLRVITPHESR